jgi:hypothetical protein
VKPYANGRAGRSDTQPIPPYDKIDAVLAQHRRQRGERYDGGRLAVEMHLIRRSWQSDSCQVGLTDIQRATGMTRDSVLNAIQKIKGQTFFVQVGQGKRATRYTFNRGLCRTAVRDATSLQKEKTNNGEPHDLALCDAGQEARRQYLARHGLLDDLTALRDQGLAKHDHDEASLSLLEANIRRVRAVYDYDDEDDIAREEMAA